MAELTPQRFRALTKEKIRDMAKNNPERLVGLIDDMKSLVLEQANKIYERGYNPIAYESLFAKSPQIFQSTPSRNNTTQREIALQLLETYKSPTMTVKGAEKAAIKQDVSIFGYEYHLTGNKKGAQLHYKTYAHRMTPEERYIFWAMYNQIKEESGITKDSDIVLQAMRETMVERRNSNKSYSSIIKSMMNDYGEFDRAFIDDALEEIKKMMEFSYS